MGHFIYNIYVYISTEFCGFGSTYMALDHNLKLKKNPNVKIIILHTYFYICHVASRYQYSTKKRRRRSVPKHSRIYMIVKCRCNAYSKSAKNEVVVKYNDL